MLGGLRLRDLRASGVRLIRIGIWCGFGFIIIGLLSYLILVFALGDPEAPEPEASPLGVILMLLYGLLSFAALAFEIVTLVWLSRHAAALPLDTHR